MSALSWNFFESKHETGRTHRHEEQPYSVGQRDATQQTSHAPVPLISN